MNQIAVFGSVNMDLTVYLPEWPKLGETVLAEDYRVGLGGKGANQCVAAARLGAQARMIGLLGDDAFANEALARLSSEGVALSLDRMPGARTGVALIDVAADGGNIIRVASGANAALTPEHAQAQADQIAAADMLLLQNETPLAASCAAARIARAAGATVVMDPAPAARAAWTRDILALFDVVTPNAQEAATLLNRPAPRDLREAGQAAEALRDAGAGGVIVTMGADGAAWRLEGARGAEAAPKVEAVDTVAAGDCFNGALAAARASNRSWPDAISFAMQAAAVATTRKGAADSLPRLEEISSR